MDIRVALSTTNEPLSLQLPKDARLSRLQEEILKTGNIDPGRNRLRIIFAGKQLTEPTQKLLDVGISNGSCVHCVVSDVQNNTLQREEDAREDHDTNLNNDTLIQLDPSHTDSLFYLSLNGQALETLRRAGITEDEITALRIHYDLNRDPSNNLQQALLERDFNDNTEINEFYDIEIDEGCVLDFVWGMIVGFLLGIIMLILSFDRSTALSRKWRMGIIVGAGINLSLGLLMVVSQHSSARGNYVL